MDNKMDILNTFQMKLKQNVETIQILKKQINESEIRYKQEVSERQRVQHLYEREADKCRQLMDMLSTLEYESKIKTEKQSIESKEQNNLYSNQSQRMSDQIIQLKHDLEVIQTKCWTSEQSIHRKDTQLQNENIFRSSVGTEFIQIQKRSDALKQQLNSLSENQNQLKNIVKSVNDINIQLKNDIKKSNEDLRAVLNENSSLKSLICELKEKCRQREEQNNEFELQLLRSTQQKDLQKQEIIKLQKLLDESILENQLIRKEVTGSQNNFRQTFEFNFNNEDSILSAVETHKIFE